VRAVVRRVHPTRAKEEQLTILRAGLPEKARAPRLANRAAAVNRAVPDKATVPVKAAMPVATARAAGPPGTRAIRGDARAACPEGGAPKVRSACSRSSACSAFVAG